MDNPFISPIQNQAMGFVSPAETEREQPLDISRQLIAHPAATFLLRASSHWPEFGICSGDMLVVDRAWDPATGLLALGIQDGDFCLGRLKKTSHGWLLGRVQIGAEDQIWGVVCHVIRQFV